MAHVSAILVLLLVCLASTSAGQDARSVVHAAATTMGATNLTSIQFSGAGWIAGAGSPSDADDWPAGSCTILARNRLHVASSRR